MSEIDLEGAKGGLNWIIHLDKERELADCAEQALAAIEALEQERDTLRAEVERLRELLSGLTGPGSLRGYIATLEINVRAAHDQADGYARERDVALQECDRLRAVIRETHRECEADAWKSRRLHAPECCLYEIDEDWPKAEEAR